MAISRKSIAESLVMGIIIASTVIGLALYTSISLAGHNLQLSSNSSSLHTASSIPHSVSTSSPPGSFTSIISLTTTTTDTGTSVASISDTVSTTASSRLSTQTSNPSTLSTPPSTSLTSSSSSSTTSAGTQSSSSFSQVAGTYYSIAGLTMTGFGANVSSAAYDPVNGLVYATGTSQLLVVRDGILVNELNYSNSIFNGYQTLAVNTDNGTLYSLAPGRMGHNGCALSWMGSYNGQNVSTWFGAGFEGSTGPMIYDSTSRYLAIAVGGAGAAGACGPGLVPFATNSSVYFIPVGPQPLRTNPSSIPALAYDSSAGRIFVPVINDTVNNANTSVYAVSGFNASSTPSFNLPGKTTSLLFDNQSNYLYAEQELNNHSVSIAVENTVNNSTVGYIPLDSNSTILVYDSRNNVVLAFEPDKFLEISGGSVLHSYPEPTGKAKILAVVYDAKDNLFVEFSGVSSSTSSSSSSSGSMTINETLSFADNKFAYDSSNGYTYGIYTQQPNATDDYVVSVLNGQKLVTNISTSCVSCAYRSVAPTGGVNLDRLSQITYDPVTKLVYAFEEYQNSLNGTVDTFVHVINGSSNTVVSNYEIRGYIPSGVAAEPTNGNIFLYSAINSSPELLVMNGSSGAIVANITSGLAYRSGSGAIVFDPLNHGLFTTDGQIVNTTNFRVANFTGEETALDLGAYDAHNNFVYMGWSSVILCCTPRNASILAINGSINYLSIDAAPPSIITVLRNQSNWSTDSGVIYDSLNGNLYVSSSYSFGDPSGSFLIRVNSTSNAADQITPTPNISLLAFNPTYNVFYGLTSGGKTVIVTISA